jgi:D-alanyl-D-alanine carboxypeptidase/D-alanyl-D-alanine-endopeptidase (penicillin-binding protein 4)
VLPLIALWLGSISQAAESPRERGAGSLPELQAQLEAHVTRPEFEGALWAVKVASLETGRILFEHHPRRLMSPASNAKLYVGALALDRLGGDYRVATPILASAAPDRAGTVQGDIVVSGRGDPSWTSRRTHRDFWRLFDPFIAVLERAGVRRITGDLVADATFFRGPPYGAGWTAEDLDAYYGAEISALSLEDNYAEIRVRPADTAGAACELTLLQPHTGLVLENRTVTAAPGSARRIEVFRLPGESIVHVFGELPAAEPEEIVDVTVPYPSRWFASALKAALERRGIKIEGSARARRWPDAPAHPANWVTLGETRSPPLRELVAAFMKPSQNLQTDLVFGHLGERSRTSESPRTSEQAALRVLREFLQENRLPAEEVRFDEGSGLSRNNLTTANATLALLTFMHAHREAENFEAALPVAGVDGTLRRRMKTTAAEGNVRAKTGTLRWANSLSGYVTSAAGERLVFSVMLNRKAGTPTVVARDDVDAIATMLAQWKARSDEAKSPER